jgi:hypothetical protein
LGSAASQLFKGISCHKKPNLTNACKHAKAARIFLQKFPFLSLAGAAHPQGIGKFERSELAMLLMSRDSSYPKECTADSFLMLRKLKSEISRLPEEQKEPLKDTLALLKGAETIFKELSLLENYAFADSNYVSSALSKVIGRLERKNKNIFEKVFFKEGLSRFLSFGLSFAAAVDLTKKLIVDTIFIVAIILADQLFPGAILGGSGGRQLFKWHIRDLFLTAAAVATGSIAGLINPNWGCSLANLNSPLYKNLRDSLDGVKIRLRRRVDRLLEGESLLIPVSFSLGSEMKSGHIVYVLATKEKEGFRVSVLNKGFGASYAILRLHKLGSGAGMTEGGKIPLNFTVEGLPSSDVKEYLSDMIELMHETDSSVDKKATAEKKKPGQYVLARLYLKLSALEEKSKELKKWKKSGELPASLFVKPQTKGDCPKSSLLGALYYHSAYNRKKKQFDKRPYKLFLRQLKDSAYEREWHLLDFNFGLNQTGVQPSALCANKLKSGWQKFNSLYAV